MRPRDDDGPGAEPVADELLRPGRRVVATAPVRVADVGGWTDTWFAERGAVCSVAVGPGARVEARVVERTDHGPAVRIAAPDLGATWTLHLDARATTLPTHGADAHGLLDRAVLSWAASLPEEALGPQSTAVLAATVTAGVPPGSSVGTSASVLVALVAALEALAGRPVEPDAAARAAHGIETQGAGRESGVQDHVAAACGGISWVEIDPYPTWRRTEVDVPAPAAAGLGRRLLTVHLGGVHDSSELHRAVIARAEAGDAEVRSVLVELRTLAAEARDRLVEGDLTGWGAVLTAATEAQGRLHPALVSAEARALARLGAARGAEGWKVNGAGGAGGSVTLLGPDDPEADALLRQALADADPRWRVLDLSPASGLRLSLAG
jgi:D-glycero-alpha-D-manno-heptose-7-phosphate kinase